MAKGLSDDEIMKFIKSKDVSSKDYKAPKTKITKIDLSKIKTDNVKNTKTDNSVKNKVLRRTLVNTKPDNSNKKVNQTIYNKNAVRTSQKPEPKSIGSIDIVRNQSELRKTQNELQRQREKKLNPEGKNAAVETVKQAKQAMRAVENVGEKEAKNLIDFSTNAYKYAKAIKNRDDKQEAEAVSNMANAFDRSLVGRGVKTAGNFATITGYGALEGADWMLDWGIDKMTSKPLQYARFAEKALNPDKKEEINKKYDTIQNYLDDYTKLNLAENIYEDLGWDEDAYRTWEKGSLVNRNNIGGQVAETMGEQFLPLLLGSEISSGLVGNEIGNKFAGTKLSKATAGLTGANKYLTGLKTAGENAAKYFIKNAPSMIPFWTTSYGGALEEALNEGATREEARRYSTLNAAVETWTEMMFDGIPAIKGSSSTADAIANGLIDKATGKITNKFAKQVVSYLARMGYVGAGEGAEEMVSEILNPALKNATYSNGEKIDWKQVLQSGMMGFISGEIMGAQNTFEESRNAVNNQINRETFQNSIQNTVNNAAQTTFQEITSQLDQLAQQRVQQIDQAVRQGQMTAQEGTQEIEDIQRYVDAQKNTLQQEQQPQQNQNNQLAQQAVQQINQQVQSGQISPQDGIQQIEDIQNYLRAQEAQTQQSGNLVQDYMNDNYESLVGDYIDENYEGIEEPTNVGKHYGDLGKAHDTNYFSINGSKRGTGHFGNGTYFVSNDYEVGPNSTYAKRPVNTASFDGYNLATPKTAQDGFDLHDALKEINYNNTPISKELYDKLLPYYEASFGTTNSMLDEESFNDYKNIRNLLKQAGVETEEFNGDSYSRYERDLEDKITDVLNNYDRFSRAEKDLKRILNINDKQLNNALEAVRNAKQKYDNYNDDQKLKADSLSTIFMKKLGFDGVDVRHLKELNDTEFGSVIYDLKPNQQNKQQESNLVEDYMNNGEDNLVNDYMNDYEDGNMVENYMNTQNNQAQIQQENVSNQNNVENVQGKGYNKVIKEEGAENEFRRNEFRRLQEESRNISNEEQQSYRRGSKEIDENLRRRLSRALGQRVESSRSSNSNNARVLKDNKSGNTFEIYDKVDGQTFRDVFEIARTYTKNGELVDLHPVVTNEDAVGYNDTDNYVTKDGLSGYAITKDGDLISVFNANNKRGWLRAIEPDIRKNAKTLDCYMSENQPLHEMYEKIFGFKTASVMDYNMEYDHDDIAKNHNMPQVAFMVKTDQDIETKHFNKDQYDEALEYRNSLVDNQGTSDSSFSNEQTNTPETKNEQSIKIELTGVPKNQIKTENTGISIGNKPVQIEVPINSSQNKLGQYVPKDGFTKKELKNGKVGDSKFYKNVTERADFISDEVREQAQSDDYIKHHRKITNDESMQMAFDDLNTRGTEAIADFFNNDKELTSKDTAMGWLLIEQSQANGDYNFSNQVLRKMRSSATKTGQAMQMYNYYARLTPEGMYRWCGDQLLRAEEIFEKNKTKKWIEANKNRWQLNGEEVEFIKDQMKKVQKLNKMNDSDTTTIDIKGKPKKVTVDRAKQVEIAKIQAMIEDKIPHQKGQALNAWMRISMLGNLKTIGTRNPLGNIALRPVNDAGDFVSSLVDYAISKKTGVRTKGNLNIKAQAKGFKKGSSEAIQDFRLGIDTKNQKGNRFEIGQGKSFNEKHVGAAKVLNPLSKVGNKADSGVSFLLDLGDRPFYEAAYAQSLENQMKLNGIEKVEDATEWMKKIAEQEALERTYQDDNNYTAAVVDIRKAMNKFNVKGYGLGDVMIPFAKTLANLTKAIVDYSPAGFVSALTKGNELRTAINNEQFTPEMQHRFVNQLGKATAGTILYAIGAAFANSGLITGGSDDDDDVADFMRNTLGIQPYSIKIGNKSFTYDWAQPVASAFAIPADIKKGIQDAKNQEVDLQYIIHKSFSTAGNILLEQSFLQGIKEVLGGYGDPLDNLMSEIEGLPARAVPTLFQQMVTYLDPTKRMSYGNKGIQNVISQAIAKTPLAKDLPVYRNTMGKEIKMYGGKNSFFNVFINPSNYSEGNATKSAEEIYAIYQATNDKTILPRTVGKDLRNEDGTKLTNQQKSDFLKISGDFIDENVEKLTESNEYKNMSNEDKAATIKYIVDYAYNKARKEITGHKLSSEHQKTENAEKSGYTMADYFISKKTNKVKTSKSTTSRNRYKELEQKGIDGRTFDDFVSFVKKTKGDSKKGGLSKKQKVINYIEGLSLSKQAKEALYEDYKKNQKVFTVYN